ncbi:MAG: acyl-homoserine-lactone acylase [Thermomicrobiales bacterium]|nr:acyl-homoserine-lactone acylase [Thermomicrobiales bacterium]
MDKLQLDAYQEALARKLSRRAALARLAGGGVAATLTIAGRGETRGAASLATPVATPGPATPAPAGTEVLWDTWGTPHVFANDAPGLFYGFGWAQAHNHGDLLLRLYAQARGRAAEVFGEDFLVSDRAIRTMGLHDRGRVWYDAQSPEFRANLDAFADGINAYARQYPERLGDAGRMVLPVAGVDVTAHTARILYLFLAGDSGILQYLPSGSAIGSNGWAIAPSHTADGHTLLLANPHLLWAEEHTFFEAQLSAPGVYDAYGAALVGLPVLAIAFNDHLGWTHTNNTIDPADVYLLTLVGDGYRFDGQTRAFETRTETIKVRQEGGTLREESLMVRRSVHGPVVETAEGQTVAIRMAGVDEWSSAAGTVEQWWDMGRAQDFAGFEAVLRRLQLPYFTVIYADRDGHILSLFNGHAPVRPAGNIDWSGPVPGDTSATLWTKIHPYEDLPKVVDPPAGWVQNSNSPPWYTTYPLVLDPADYPPDLAPRFLEWRERRSIRMLEETPSMSLERMVELKYSTRMELADRVLDELIAAAQQSRDAAAKEAADVLAAWDRQALPTSTGALLFLFWVQALQLADPLTLSDLFSTPWDPAKPLTTPSGLKDPDKAVRALTAAAEQVQALFGRLDIPWGEVARVQRGSLDLPANGFRGDPFGVFRVLFFDSSTVETTKEMVAFGGDSYVAAVEFGETVRAQVLMTYGNASQPGSPHLGDQLVLSVREEMRPAWQTREEIEANLEAHDELG